VKCIYRKQNEIYTETEKTMYRKKNEKRRTEKKTKKEEAVSYAKMQLNYILYLINSAITKYVSMNANHTEVCLNWRRCFFNLEENVDFV